MTTTRTFMETVVSRPTYRAQIKSNDGTRWVDGNLYGNPEQAQQNAAELYAQYGNRTRVVGDAHDD